MSWVLGYVPSQLLPLKPCLHIHLYCDKPFVKQVPAFKQGETEHGDGGAKLKK